MSCVLTNGWPLNCRSIAGIQAVYIGTWQEPGPNSMTFGLTASGEITSFTGATVSFFKFTQDSEVGSYTEVPNVSIDNGTYFIEGTLEFTLYNYQQTLKNIVNILGQGRSRVIFLTEDGNYFLLGFQNPVNISGGNFGVGKAYGELNGAMITMTSKEQLGAVQVSSAAAASVISYS